jgi:hypothetical protein
VTASDYRPLSRRILCEGCNAEQWFTNTAANPTRWKCQKCGASCFQGAQGISEPDDWEGIAPASSDLGGLELEETDLVPSEDAALAPVSLTSAFDLALPLTDRAETFTFLLALAAEWMVERDEAENPDAYADPDFRRQEVARRTLKGICDLRQIANTLELRWAMEHEGETWIDADGAETSLLETIESQMPDEEQRKSSGRARQTWSFLDAAQAFRDVGIQDAVIAECSKSGLSSVLGITASAQRKLAKDTPAEDLREKYEQLIEMASETTHLDDLKKRVRALIDPSDEPPPSIPYSVESDGDEHWWLVARPTHEQFTEVVLAEIGGALELDKQLPQYFYAYWDSFINVPSGQD